MKYVFGEKVVKTPHGEYLRPEEIKENESKYGALACVQNDRGQIIKPWRKRKEDDR